MPHSSVHAHSSKRPVKHQSSNKQLHFSTVEEIPDLPCTFKTPKATPRAIPARHSSSKLKRSPTPVLTSLTELTNAHFHQLSSVWHETTLPSFESDKRAIAESRRGEKDPFDF